MKIGKIPGILGLFLITAFFSLILIFTYHSPPKESVQLLTPMVESLKAALLFALGYHFKDSKNED